MSGRSRPRSPHRHLLPVSPKAQPRRRFSPRHSPPPQVPVPVQMIAQIRTIGLFSALLAALGRRRRGSGFLARLLTEGAAQEPAAGNSAEKKNQSREEDNEENKTGRTQTTAGHKLKRHSCAGATQRPSRVSTIKGRFPRPRRSPRPW